MNSTTIEIKQQWENNIRLRGMIYIIAITLMFYFLSLLSEYSDEKLQQLSRSQTLLEKIALIQKEPIWYEREKEAASQRVSFQNQLWQASSRGLAQAKLQAFLRSTIDKLNLTNSKIVLEAVETINSDSNSLVLWKISAQIRASFNSNELQKLLWAINSHTQLIKIRSLDFKIKSNRNSLSNFTLYVDTWFESPNDGLNNE